MYQLPSVTTITTKHPFIEHHSPLVTCIKHYSTRVFKYADYMQYNHMLH